MRHQRRHTTAYAPSWQASGDRAAPHDGYRAMAESVDLALLTGKK
jgi:hypothetical protein